MRLSLFSIDLSKEVCYNIYKDKKGGNYHGIGY